MCSFRGTRPVLMCFRESVGRPSVATSPLLSPGPLPLVLFFVLPIFLISSFLFLLHSNLNHVLSFYTTFTTSPSTFFSIPTTSTFSPNVSAIARIGMSAHSGRALAQGLTTFARANASSFVSKSILAATRPQAANRLLSTTSAVGQFPEDELQAHPNHISPPPSSSQDNNAPGSAFANGLALPLDGIRILDLTRVLGTQ
ncbi:hypothetical protein K457DRAFT_1112877 [Linnemannia elongata AG-77]|uniref:Uncharacterized protein n=1 Tax=Linnemannia elongata AG-77 TaxID=1314771 RepID=A0A197JEI2_9FUNG|nr:hypothetical protein K457DRAFT_1112877 [Linnemannia elongata AG-77]